MICLIVSTDCSKCDPIPMGDALVNCLMYMRMMLYCYPVLKKVFNIAYLVYKNIVIHGILKLT